MKFKALSSLLSASLALVAQGAFASNYIPCDGCSVAQQSAAALAHGVGRYVVGNVLGKSVNAFRVYSSSHQNSIGGGAATALTQQLYVDDGAITAAETAAFAHLITFYNISPVGYQKTYNVQIVAPGASTTPPPMGNSVALSARVQPLATALGTAKVQFPDQSANAYKVLNGGPLQNQFLEWAGGLPQLSINTAMSNLVNTSILMSVGATPWAVSLTVYFQDNSHVGVYVDMTQQPPAILVNTKSAVDSHGNQIPASQSTVAGAGRQNYDFSGAGNITDRPNMADQIAAFGISVPSTGGGYSCASRDSGSGVIITCKAL